MDIKKLQAAIEKDAGEKISGLEESLKEMRDGKIATTYTPEQILLHSARESLRLSQRKFAVLIDTPIGTLRDWEQGRFVPPGSTMCLLKLAIKHPAIVKGLDKL